MQYFYTKYCDKMILQYNKDNFEPQVCYDHGKLLAHVTFVSELSLVF
jgi:hypothetical protein